MIKHCARSLLALLLLLPSLAWGQDERPPVTRTYFIDQAFVVTEPGVTIDMGAVIIRDGLIQAVGKGLKAPADAKVIEGDSLYVYAGFIDGLSYAAVPKPKDSNERPQVKNPGSPPNDIAGIQPERSVVEMLKADDKSVGELKALGFTAAHVVPRGKMLPGKGAVILLGGDTGEDMVLKEETSLFAQFKGSGGRYFPSTDMAIVAKWRELYAQANQQKQHAKRYGMNPRGMTRNGHSDVLKAFSPVLDGKQPVFFHVTGIKQLHRALSLAEELDFPMVLTGTGRAQLAMDRIKASNTALFLDLDLPKSKSKKAAKTDDDSKEANAENTTKPGEETKARLEARRATAMEEFEQQAAMLAKAGMTFGFTTAEAKAKEIRENLGRMIKAGLTEDQALAALTTSPAKMLGLDAMLGTVAKGKIANLVVTDKPYFAEKSNVRYVFVDGMPTEYEVKKKKKKKPGDPDATVNVLGSWQVEIDSPMSGEPGTMVLSGDADNLSGTMTTSGQELELSNVTLDGDNLTFTAKIDGGGQSISLTFDLTVDGESMEGSVAAGNFGSFDVEAERTEKPEGK